MLGRDGWMDGCVRVTLDGCVDVCLCAMGAEVDVYGGYVR